MTAYEEFPDYAALTELLHQWASKRPDLLALESIGRSWEGRDIWFLTVTNTETGPAADKPALLVEANIHAAEITSSMAALHLVRHLITAHGIDDQVTRLLDTRCVYVIPRLCPDGVEGVLREHRYVRSSMRPYPDDVPQPGHHHKDVDGDGRVLFMRVPDSDGPWKLSEQDARLLVRRGPDEYGGTYYRLYVEGDVVEYDGLTVPEASPYEGLDLAANFHAAFGDPVRSSGAGRFTGSEPEIQALLQAVVERPNIGAYVSCHTFGAVHLHPPLNDHERVPPQDAAMFADLGQLATERTDAVSMSYNELKHRRYDVSGGQLAWFYQERGVVSWISELWNPLHAAGVQSFHPAAWLLDHAEADDHALLRWNDEQLAGEGFVDWYPFDHPQLGPLELGGWDLINYWYNPPFELVEDVIAPQTSWLISLGLTLPRLAVRDTLVEAIAEDVFRVSVAISNTGWLPTTATRWAAERNLCPPVTVTVRADGDVQIISGAGPAAIGQLEGRTGARTSTTWWGHDAGTPDVAVHQIVVQAPTGGEIDIVAQHDRAGVAQTRVRLG